ncbi:hypothetical protein [Alteromonas sp. a30]|uniref:hypothetical protein n=1 Tax=Alteromonas sp. a30 TaxID=2730917 RepID=UPI00227FC862|nr:hypothetical protein [Alteromonas sp. a30]MCY7295085.1 hypothetical protein [Alteromonas sp. a30]
MIRLLVILITAYLTFTNINNDHLIDMLFILVGVWALYENRYHISIYSTIIFIIAMRGVEWGLTAWLGSQNPLTLYPTNLFIDFTTVLLIMLKVPLVKAFSEKTGKLQSELEHLHTTGTDFLLTGIYGLYLVITLLSFIEHWFRHIDDIPYAHQFFDYLLQFEWIKSHYATYQINNAQALFDYFYLHARHVYDAAPTFKLYLNTLEHVVILSSSYEFMRSHKTFHA